MSKWKIGDKIIILTSEYGLGDFTGTIQTITRVKVGCLLFDALGFTDWNVAIEDVIRATPLLEALE
jgi:hypothetical protein